MSQQDEILAAFKRGDSITPIEALEKYGCFRLAAVVFSLKKRGYDIKTELVDGGENRFARYWMEQPKTSGCRLIENGIECTGEGLFGNIKKGPIHY